MLTGRLSVDIGGTFTDLALVRSDGALFTGKTSSTPAEPEEAVIRGAADLLAAAGLSPADVTEVVHGTTVGSNILVQRSGARCGLITTRGFRDVLEIGRLRTPGMFDLRWDKPAPLVPRRHRLEAEERTLADGTILTPLVVEDVLRAGRFFRDEGLEAVAICFLNSYRNPANERAAAAALAAAFPDLAVAASIDVLPVAGEYERTSTTVVNAYILPPFRGYLDRLERRLRAHGIAAPLLVGNSNGELAAVAAARAAPVFFVSSGRASGAVGAQALGAAMGAPDVVAFDMGGTTASAALVHRGELSRTQEYEFRAGMSVTSRFIKAGGYLMRVPSVDVAEVGCAAGSIASVDPAGLLQVGPRSAGADPGPACYGLGGTAPTVTDANLALGYLPAALAGGALALDAAAARAAIERAIARPLGLTVEAAAHGIRAVADATMLRAIRAVTVERGLDPRDLTLLAFGGSGPAHACGLAAALGIGRVIFPPSPGVFTALGMLAGVAGYHDLRPLPGSLERLDGSRIEALAAEMRAAGAAELAAEGYPAEQIAFRTSLDLRLRGQEAALAVAFDRFDPAALRASFAAAYGELYGYAPGDAVESVLLRLDAEARPAARLDFPDLRPAPRAATAGTASRAVCFDGARRTATPVVPREGIGGPMAGPLIVEAPDTTIVVPPGATIAPHPTGSLIATLEGAP